MFSEESVGRRDTFDTNITKLKQSISVLLDRTLLYIDFHMHKFVIQLSNAS